MGVVGFIKYMNHSSNNDNPYSNPPTLPPTYPELSSQKPTSTFPNHSKISPNPHRNRLLHFLTTVRSPPIHTTNLPHSPIATHHPPSNLTVVVAPLPCLIPKHYIPSNNMYIRSPIQAGPILHVYSIKFPSGPTHYISHIPTTTSFHLGPHINSKPFPNAFTSPTPYSPILSLLNCASPCSSQL